MLSGIRVADRPLRAGLNRFFGGQVTMPTIGVLDRPGFALILLELSSMNGGGLRTLLQFSMELLGPAMVCVFGGGCSQL